MTSPAAASPASGFDAVLALIGDLARFWLELLLLAVPVGAGGLLWYYGFSPTVAIAAPAIVSVTLVAVPAVRRAILRALLKARWRRRLQDAVDTLSITGFRSRRPSLGRVTTTASGVRLSVVLPPGGAAEDLGSNAERLAVLLASREVRVRRDPTNACLVDLVVAWWDPLDSVLPPWPRITAMETSLWEPIPIGVDEDGHPVGIALPEHNVLIGGEPGGGKSAALSMLVAAAAMDPLADLWLFDGKLVELAPWRRLAREFLGPDLAPAVAALRELHGILEERYRSLLDAGVRKVSPGDGLGLHVVVVDELAMYLTGGDKVLRAEFTDLLRDLVSRGRAAGIIVLAATQKPGSDIIPTSLRDLFGYRWAMRCTTPQASDTILGAGWASLGMSAATISPEQRGVGYLLAEGGVPKRCRSYFLHDGHIAHLVGRALERRADSAAVMEL